jgi:hypothetical protein
MMQATFDPPNHLTPLLSTNWGFLLPLAILLKLIMYLVSNCMDNLVFCSPKDDFTFIIRKCRGEREREREREREAVSNLVAQRYC